MVGDLDQMEQQQTKKMDVTVVEEKKPGYTKRDAFVVFLAELLGTAMLLFGGCLCTVQFEATANHLATALGFGFLVAAIISFIGIISHAHINPCLSICSAMLGIIPYKMLCVYIPAQIIGAILGFGLMAATMPTVKYTTLMDNGGICMSLPGAGMTAGKAFLSEFLLTMILIFICCSVWDKRNASNTGHIAVKFGVTIAALAIMGGHLSGTSMNPARSLGPAIWNNNYTHHWVYWVAPISSAIVTTFTFKLVFLKPILQKED